MKGPCVFCGQQADTTFDFENDYLLWYPKIHYKSTKRSKRISVCTPCEMKWRLLRLAPWGLVLLGVGFFAYFALVVTPQGNAVASANSYLVGLAFIFGIVGILGYWIVGLIKRSRIMRWLETYDPGAWEEVRRGANRYQLSCEHPSIRHPPTAKRPGSRECWTGAT